VEFISSESIAVRSSHFFVPNFSSFYLSCPISWAFDTLLFSRLLPSTWWAMAKVQKSLAEAWKGFLNKALAI
jgi:hypothetical protein